MEIIVVIKQLIVFVILIATGLLLYKKDIVDESSAKHISALITNLCNPMLMLSSCLNDTNKASHREVLLTFALSAMIYGILILLGFLIPRLMHADRVDSSAYHMMCVYGNAGFIGIPLVQALLGDSAVIYVTIFTLLYVLLIYTHGIWVLSKSGGDKEKFRFVKILTPGFVIGLLAVIVYWFDIRFPEVITRAVTYAGSSTTFLSMVVLGVSFSAISVRKLLGNLRLHLFVFIRFLIVPIAIGFLLKLLGVGQMMATVLTIMAAVPAGNMPLMLSHERKLPTETLTYGIAWSTLLSVVTITLVLAAVG